MKVIRTLQQTAQQFIPGRDAAWEESEVPLRWLIYPERAMDVGARIQHSSKHQAHTLRSALQSGRQRDGLQQT